MSCFLIRFFLCLALGQMLSGLVAACELRDGESTPMLWFPPKYKAKEPAEDYTFKIIQLILNKSEAKYGPCDVRILRRDLPLRRMMLYLEKNELIDVISLTVNQKRETTLIPIKIPIAKGMVGFRVFIIRKGDQPRFSQINNLEDLRGFVAGQGKGWSDVEVLAQTGLRSVTTDNVPSLVNMLVAGRFDYYPRGARQLIPELKIYEGLPVQVESKLVLSYPSMTALYVNPERQNLAQRLEYGLNIAIADGSVDKLFYTHPTTSTALKKLNFEKRTIIKMCNPMIPDWVPTDKSNYWLYPWPKDLCARNGPRTK